MAESMDTADLLGKASASSAAPAAPEGAALGEAASPAVREGSALAEPPEVLLARKGLVQKRQAKRNLTAAFGE